MRVLILIALLCNVAFSALYLNGAEYTQVVTINHSQVAETSSDFLFQLKIPRVGNLITAVESADDVAFTNVSDTTRRARWVVYTPDTIFMYSHIAVSSTADTSYRLQYGQSLNETNDSATFTNCGIGYAITLNETSGTTVGSYTGSGSGTTIGPTLGGSGFFGNSATFPTAASYINMGSSVNLNNKAILSFSTILKISNVTATNRFYTLYGGAATRIILSIDGTSLFWIVSNGGTAYGSYVYGTDIQNGMWVNISGIYDGTKTGNANRLRLWVNGIQKTLSFTGTIPATTPNIPATPFYLGNTGSSLVGNMDELLVSTTDSIPVVDMYNMLFNSSTFSTLGTPIATEISAEMGIDTLTFTCSAEGAITYQWYLDGAEIVGETDSVLVIYADSTFYSTAHTLYCLVNGSVISDSWVITTEFSAEMGIDTLTLTCSAENALTYQWYDNNVAVTGATDSVYTIYADSTFYSIKHVIYCLVNGTVKSGEWKFQTPGIINRKITIGPNLKIY